MSWFNAAEHKPEVGSAGALVGKYPLRWTSAAQRVNQNADGASLVLGYVVTAGELANQNGALRINIWNKDDTARRIASGELSAICHVCNVLSLDAKPEGIELVGRECVIEVQYQKEPNPNKYTNLVGVFDMQGNPPKAGIFGAAQPQPGPNFGAMQAQLAMAPQPGPQFAPAQPPQGYPQPQQQPQPAFAPNGGQQPQFAAAPAAPAWQQQPQTAAKPAWER